MIEPRKGGLTFESMDENTVVWSFKWNFSGTVEPRFNEVAGDRPNLFVKSRVR